MWLLLLLVVAASGVAVGPAAPYALPPVARIEPPPPPAAPDVAQLRAAIQQHARSLALLVSVVLLLATAGSCIASSDECVRRRLNWRRRLPIGVVDEQPTSD